MKKTFLLVCLLIISVFFSVFFTYTLNNCNSEIRESKILYPIKDKKKDKVLKDTVNFIYYWNFDNESQIPYKTKELRTAKIQLFPNYHTRTSLNIKEISDVYGINQFFMDFDMTTGYVHEFTNNFFKKLRDDDYVLILERDKTYVNEGVIYYKKVKNLKSDDKLGQNVGFFRQWKLSEIDIKDSKFVNFIKSDGFYFLHVKENTTNPFNKYIPLWSSIPQKDGYIEYEKLNKLSDNDGGTAVILWEVDNEIFFTDIHSSISDIIKNLYYIKNTYNVDPILGVFDAGPMTRKFKSNQDGRVLFENISNKISKISYVGAGFGYKLKQ
jgi:hypothetical protein